MKQQGSPKLSRLTAAANPMTSMAASQDEIPTEQP